MSWFLKFWAISAACSVLIELIVVAAIKAELHERYIFLNKRKRVFAERVYGVLPCLIPFAGIVFAIILIFTKEDVGRNLENRLLREGWIVSIK